MAPRTGIRAVLGPAAALLAATTALLPGEAPGRSHRPQEPELVKAVAVAGAAGWVDTGVEVAAGDRLLIRASGRVSLQTGNPAAGTASPQ